MIKKTKIVAQIMSFAFARYISEAIYIIRGFVLAVIFGPELFGVWTSMKILLKIAGNVDLGVFNALMREIPYEKGKGNLQKIDNLESAAFSFILLLTLIAALIAIIYVFTNCELSIEMQWLWAGLIAIYIVNQVFNYIITRFFAHKKFSGITQGVLGVSILSTVLGTILAYVYGLGGFLFALWLTYIAAAVYMVVNVSQLPRIRWNFALDREMISIGLPISLSGILTIFLHNIDKLLIWQYMSHEDLGIYAVQFYFTSFLLLLPKMVSLVFYPHIMEHIGREQNTEGIKQYLKQPVLVLSYVLCPVIGIMIIGIHLPFQWILQKYSEAILPGQILLCASFFMILAYMPRILLISLKRQHLVLVITALSVLCAAVLDIYAIKAGYGIIGVAIGTSISFVIYSVITMLSCVRTIRMPIREFVHYIVLTVFPFLVMLLTVLVIEGMIPVAEGSWVSDVIYTTIKTFILAIIMIAVFYSVNKQFRFLEASHGKE